MKYDDATWHSGGQGFPDTSPPEYGGTHIALFLKWCFIQGWAGADHLENRPKEVKRVRDGTMAATNFLFNYCDGKFTSEDLTDAGNRFAGAYYESGYLRDYSTLFGPMTYALPEKDHDFAMLSAMLNDRLRGLDQMAPAAVQSEPLSRQKKPKSLDPRLIVPVVIFGVLLLEALLRLAH